MRVLVIDVGGSHVKLLRPGMRKPLKLPSGPDLTPRRMVSEVKELTSDWKYDLVSIGVPAPVARGRIIRNPVNLGDGWVGFNFRRAIGKPVRLVNDAVMQAIGSYAGGNMLFLGLGTGLGTTLIRDGVVAPLEIAHLPYRNGKTYEDYIGERGVKWLGKAKWARHVEKIVRMFAAAFVVDYVVLGGGNVRHLHSMPRHARRGRNANAFRGGHRVWDPPFDAP